MNKLNQIQEDEEICKTCNGEDLKYYGHDASCADCGDDKDE